MSAFPVSQEWHLCRWRSRQDVLLRTCAVHGVECSTLTTLNRRGIPLRRLSFLVYYCLVCCLPPASSRPEQDTPILALPLYRRRRCTRIAFGSAQDIRTINGDHFYCLPATRCSYCIWCQHTVLCCTKDRVKEKRFSKEGSREKVLHRQRQHPRQFHPLLL